MMLRQLGQSLLCASALVIASTPAFAKNPLREVRERRMDAKPLVPYESVSRRTFVRDLGLGKKTQFDVYHVKNDSSGWKGTLIIRTDKGLLGSKRTEVYNVMKSPNGATKTKVGMGRLHIDKTDQFLGLEK